MALAHGKFFGSANRSIRTENFQFSEFEATVPEREVPRHTHETPHFIVVLRGIYSTEACKARELYSSSTLIFNPAGTTHRDCFRSPEGKFLSISLGADGAELLSRNLLPARVMAGGLIRSPDCMRVLGQIMREFERLGRPSSVVLEGLGLELLGESVRRLDASESRHVPDWLLRTKEWMEDCAGDNLSISQLATAAAVHPVYLARAFRKYFGRSPGEYLRHNRLRRAQSLLAKTRLPLVDIALQCGFSDQSRMTHAFTGEFGVTPSQYRRLRCE